MITNKQKFTYEEFFKTNNVIYIADLIATKIESEEKYYIHKDKYVYINGDIVSKEDFEKVLKTAERPIVLSDLYIDLEK